MTHKPRPRPVRSTVPAGRTADRTVERSAGGVVVRLIEGAPHILLIRDPYRKWGLPKGHLEAGEGFPEAALREVREETGLDDLRLGPDLGEIDWTFRKENRLIHKYCRFYLMTSPEGDPFPEVSEGITECRWLPVHEAVRTVAYDNARIVLRRGVERLVESPDDAGPLWRES
jgi:ADP-ribose pyrophosphatase YjhB (NUDIX family)